MVQNTQPILAILSVAVHLAVDVPVVQLQRSSLCCRSDMLVLAAGVRGCLFRALYTGTGPGAVSRGTRLP